MAKSIGIISNGKFSQLMQTVFKETLPGVQVKVSSGSAPVDNKIIFPLEEVAKCDIVIPSVPISAFESMMKKIKPMLGGDTIIVEVCSIKVYPKKILHQVLGEDYKYICTHPMFGPESYRENGNSVKGLNMMLENQTLSDKDYQTILDYLKKLELNIIEMDCEEHDRLASEFQFTTLFTGILLKNLGIKRTKIDTASASRMHDFVERVGDDLQIVQDMYKYNPYCREQMDKLRVSFRDLVDSVLVD